MQLVFFDPSEQESLKCHRPYEFVLNQLISNACVFDTNNQQKNRNRYLAVHFSSIEAVPSYLLSGAYDLPSQFPRLIQNVFGIVTYFSFLFTKIFEQNVPEYQKRKKQLQALSSSLNEAEHQQCDPTTCRKV